MTGAAPGDRVRQTIAEERRRGVLSYVWISYVLNNKSAGVTIVRDYGFSCALEKARALNINPGGEAAGSRIDVESELVCGDILKRECNKLLSPERAHEISDEMDRRFIS